MKCVGAPQALLIILLRWECVYPAKEGMPLVPAHVCVSLLQYLSTEIKLSIIMPGPNVHTQHLHLHTQQKLCQLCTCLSLHCCVLSILFECLIFLPPILSYGITALCASGNVAVFHGFTAEARRWQPRANRFTNTGD